jgi:predicted RNase H-like HicB family nuclease
MIRREVETAHGVYGVELIPDEEVGGFTVLAPALPGCISEGDDEQEALAMIREAIEGYIASLKKHGEPVPRPLASVPS